MSVLAGASPAPDHPTCVALLDIRIDQRVARETTPGFQVSAKTCFAACDGNKIAGTTSAQRSNKVEKQAGSKRFNAGVDLDFRSHPRLLTIRQNFDRHCLILGLKRVTLRLRPSKSNPRVPLGGGSAKV